MLVNSADEPSVALSQILQADLASVGVTLEFELLEGAELTDRLLAGDFDSIFGGIGNVQKFPSRVATNSIYRTADNPVLGDLINQEPFTDYVDAINQVNTTLGPDDAIQAAYDNLNSVLMDLSFALPTNTYQYGLIIASPDLDGVWLDIDNIFIGRTISKP
jgi:peptide/nickel transport system substrate-binding protein